MTQSQQQLDAWLKKRGGWNGTKKSTKVSLFTLPVECIPCLSAGGNGTDDVNVESKVVKPALTDLSKSASRGLTCIACHLVFDDVREQQLHFKSDLHLLNLKRRVQGLSSLLNSDANTGDLAETGKDPTSVEEDDEGSDGSEDRDVDIDNETISSENFQPTGFANELGSISKEFSAQRGSTLHLRDAQLPQWELVVSTGMFPSGSVFHTREWSNQSDASQPSPWAQLSTQIDHIRRNKICGVFLLRSGRFAGAIFDKQTLLIHKVMRRYTVRAKAGGGQSSHDNKSGKAKSAGAMLRRYGEQALKEDIAACLALWSGHIQSCSLILISAPKTMRSSLFDTPENPSSSHSSHSGGSTGAGNSNGGVLSKDDPRIAYVPFMVDRPTLDEAKMVHDRCTSVYFNRTDIAATDASKEDTLFDTPIASILKASVPMAPKAAETSNQLALMYSPISKRLFEAITNNDEAGALAVLEDAVAQGNSLEVFEQPVDAAIPAKPTEEGHLNTAESSTTSTTKRVAHQVELNVILDLVDGLTHLTTPLHAASERGMSDLVAQLLSLGASPMLSDIRGRTSYFVAKDKETRDAFRRYRATPEGEDRWDWNAAGVGAALSEETEQAKKLREKEKEKEKKKRAAQRKKEAKIKEEEDALNAQQQLVAQQEEAKQRAENARFNAGTCASCNVSLYGKLALDLYDYKCCGGACVMQLRRKLAADAAMKRFQNS